MSRTRVTGNDAPIGRAYDNLVIVDDAYADAHVARVDVGENGSLSLVDLDSTNGLFSPDGARIAGEAPLEPGDEFRVGRTRLRVIRTDTPVPAALRETEGRIRNMTTSRLGVAGSVVAFCMVGSIFSYITTVEEFTAAGVTGGLVGTSMLVAVWGGDLAARYKNLAGPRAFPATRGDIVLDRGGAASDARVTRCRSVPLARDAD